MELRRVADALLRSQSSPLSTTLIPSSTTRWASPRQLSYRGSSCRQLQRCLSTSVPRSALRPSATATEAPLSSEKPSSLPRKRKESSANAESLSSLTSSMNWGSPRNFRPPAERRDESSSTSSWSPPPLSPEQERRFNGLTGTGTSAQDLLAAVTRRRGEERPPTPMFDSKRMLDPGSGPSLGNMSTAIYDAIPKAVRVPLKLNPSTGRSVTVAQGVDASRAFWLVETSCSRNRVRSDMSKQRFHERGGLKRKRLRRERWRKRFMEGFKATVGRVKQLKKQGW